MDIRHLMTEAYACARRSPDWSNQCGAVVVDEWGRILSYGWNQFPIGVTPILEPKEEKYKRIQHAERDALYRSKNGVDRKFLVCPWASCIECAKAIIGFNIETVYVHQERMDLTPTRWVQSIKDAHTLLGEAGIGIVFWSGKLDIEHIYVNGELWIP